jgi:hypothetical protein
MLLLLLLIQQSTKILFGKNKKPSEKAVFSFYFWPIP